MLIGEGNRIPFERALDFANKEKITELLYPLFVHNIGALLYHPTNSNRTNAVMAAAERRKLETKHQQQGILAPPGSQAPPLHHHHSMNNPVGSHVSQPPHSIAPHPGSRPSLDRAHTFPTPPTSASSGVGMGNQGSSYDSWGSGIGGVPSTQPLAIETHAQSTPNTPAATPPGPSMQPLQSYSGQPTYDHARPMYPSTTTTQPSQYAPQQPVPPQSMARLSGPMQPTPYLKHEMGPPSARAPGSGPELEHGDHKTDPYPHGPGNEPGGAGTGDEEAEHEHDSEYAQDGATNYSATRGQYGSYGSSSGLASLHGDHPHLSPEINGSEPHPNGSGRGTPRISAGSQPPWPAGYHTPPRATPSSNHYNVISDARGSLSNGTSGADGSYASGSLPSTYASSHVNGTASSGKRAREDDDPDHQSRPASRGEDADGLKRRKLGREGSVSGPIGGSSFDRDARPLNRVKNPITQRTRR